MGWCSVRAVSERAAHVTCLLLRARGCYGAGGHGAGVAMEQVVMAVSRRSVGV